MSASIFEVFASINSRGITLANQVYHCCMVERKATKPLSLLLWSTRFSEPYLDFLDKSVYFDV